MKISKLIYSNKIKATELQSEPFHKTARHQIINNNLNKYQNQEKSNKYAHLVDNLMTKHHDSNLIQLKYAINCSQQKELLKRIYQIQQYKNKIQILFEYYRFHSQIPKLFAKNIENIIYTHIQQKRKIQYQRVQKLLNLSKKVKQSKKQPIRRLFNDIQISYEDFENKQKKNITSMKSQKIIKINSHFQSIEKNFSKKYLLQPDLKRKKIKSSTIRLKTYQTYNKSQRKLQRQISKYNLQQHIIKQGKVKPKDINMKHSILKCHSKSTIKQELTLKSIDVHSTKKNIKIIKLKKSQQKNSQNTTKGLLKQSDNSKINILNKQNISSKKYLLKQKKQDKTIRVNKQVKKIQCLKI